MVPPRTPQAVLLERALRPFEHEHVVGLAAGREDPRHHADQEHQPDDARVLGVRRRRNKTWSKRSQPLACRPTASAVK